MFCKKLIVAGFACLIFAICSIANAQNHNSSGAPPYVDPDRMAACPNCNHQLPKVNVYGWRGTPYSEAETGGCRCGQKSGLTWYNGYCHWQSPWSVLLDHGPSGRGKRKTADTRFPRLRDCLDVFANFRLLPPVRCDNGYTGIDCDPYGLLGKSRQGIVVNSQLEDLMPRYPLFPVPATNEQTDQADEPSAVELGDYFGALNLPSSKASAEVVLNSKENVEPEQRRTPKLASTSLPSARARPAKLNATRLLGEATRKPVDDGRKLAAAAKLQNVASDKIVPKTTLPAETGVQLPSARTAGPARLGGDQTRWR